MKRLVFKKTEVTVSKHFLVLTNWWQEHQEQEPQGCSQIRNVKGPICKKSKFFSLIPIFFYYFFFLQIRPLRALKTTFSSCAYAYEDHKLTTQGSIFWTKTESSNSLIPHLQRIQTNGWHFCTFHNKISH